MSTRSLTIRSLRARLTTPSLTLAAALSGLLAVSAVAAGCSAGDESEDATAGSDALSSSTPLGFDVAKMLPTATKTFVTPSGVTELCKTVKRLPGDEPSKSDAKKEAKLCSVDFYAAGPAANVIAGGLLPKNNSTNPAVNVYEIDAAHPRSTIETQNEAFKADSDADKIGRLKQSFANDDRYGATSSYSPSIIGYYTTSRLLGDIAEVTPAVWRTMDVKKHAPVAAWGKALPLSQSRLVKKMWQVVWEDDTGAHSKSPLTYTTDNQQIYSAFIPSVSGDEKDKTIDTPERLKGSTQFRRLTDSRPVSSMFPAGSFKDAVQTIIPMQGITEMLILDSLMVQADRLSGDNISYVSMIYYKDENGKTDHMKKKDYDAAAQAKYPGGVEVRKLYMNDVDAGLAFATTEKTQAGTIYGLLKQIDHISPKLYKKMIALKTLAAGPDLQKLAQEEWRYTDRDWLRYKIMVDAVAGVLQQRCTSKQLMLDLDIGDQLGNKTVAPGVGCDGVSLP